MRYQAGSGNRAILSPATDLLVFGMAPAVSLIPELEDVVRHGSRQKRVETLQRITALFLGGASQYGNEHVALFDTVFGRLIGEIEAKAWELLLAMLVMEAAFGVPGVVAAPIYYAYVKRELRVKQLV